MEQKHPHAEAIDRLGMSKIRSHYNITRQAVYNWRKSGVPRMHMSSLRLLAMINGVQMPELDEVSK